MSKNTIKKLSYCLFWILIILFETIYINEIIVPNYEILPFHLIFLTSFARYIFYFFLFVGFLKLYDWLSE